MRGYTEQKPHVLEIPLEDSTRTPANSIQADAHDVDTPRSWKSDADDTSSVPVPIAAADNYISPQNDTTNAFFCEERMENCAVPAPETCNFEIDRTFFKNDLGTSTSKNDAGPSDDFLDIPSGNPWSTPNSTPFSTPRSWTSDGSTDAPPDLSTAAVAALSAGILGHTEEPELLQSTLQAFATQILSEPRHAEVLHLLGRQAAHVTKLLDTKSSLKTETGIQAATMEFKRMLIDNNVWDPPQELESVPEAAIIVKGKLLISMKHSELPTELQICKARFVAMGNILFNKRMRVLRRHTQSLWAPVASLMGARFVHSRALALGRDCETIDLLSAYLQILLGGGDPYFIIIPAEVIDILPEEFQAQFRSLKMPVCRLRRAIYGLMRSGFDFITAFILWLRWNAWSQMEEEPAVLYKWHTETDQEARAKALRLHEWVLKQYEDGNNPFTTPSDDNIQQPWSEVFKKCEAAPQQPNKLSSQNCSTMATYVDDCQLDAHKKKRKLIWDVIRLMFASKAPEVVQQFLGYHPSPIHHLTLPDGRTGTAICFSQSEYSERIVSDYEAITNKSVRTTETPAQQTTPPRTEDLEPYEAGTDRRKIVGEILYSARCTRRDQSFAVGRASRYVEKWNDWSELELTHLVGYIKGTIHHALLFFNAGDSWDDLYVVIWSDASFEAPKSTSGRFLELEGPKGSQYPIDWGAQRQVIQTTNSGESESVSWTGSAKAGIKLAAMMEHTRSKPVTIIGKIDNQALQQAIAKAHSKGMGHLKKHAEVSFRFLKECGIQMKHCKSSENTADALTKALGRVKLGQLIDRLFIKKFHRLKSTFDNGETGDNNHPYAHAMRSADPPGHGMHPVDLEDSDDESVPPPPSGSPSPDRTDAGSANTASPINPQGKHLTPGERMAQTQLRLTMKSNIREFKRTLGKCNDDTDQQRARQEQLQDLIDETSRKVESIDASLKEDAQVRNIHKKGAKHVLVLPPGQRTRMEADAKQSNWTVARRKLNSRMRYIEMNKKRTPEEKQQAAKLEMKKAIGYDDDGEPVLPIKARNMTRPKRHKGNLTCTSTPTSTSPGTTSKAASVIASSSSTVVPQLRDRQPIGAAKTFPTKAASCTTPSSSAVVRRLRVRQPIGAAVPPMHSRSEGATATGIKRSHPIGASIGYAVPKSIGMRMDSHHHPVAKRVRYTKKPIGQR